ncbi:hypothetical protein [Bradyrhizobium erythrophlei]|uniref:Uncharacterized protein n=1 Tax=Bradyrhizobium erythrophlei TaxID=1437360 RepID=A0A1H4NY39_9BRAD|nr:hypothetical protein [Bradyrhizobium erythrophlei]SEC00101.1 hypothetical protein SAMN05444164_0766 [Bradyrhizobium erythrophlei]
MFSGATLAAVLTALQPLLEAFFNAFGSSLNDYLARQRADQNAKDLGAAQATVQQQNATIDAQQAELEAQANAPKSVDDAIKRLEEGSA